jgi:hypothetical protein
LWGDDPTVSSRKKGGVVVIGVGGNSNNRLRYTCRDCNRLNCNCYEL